MRPTSEKVEAIQKAPSPRNKTELQSFLGLLNFYSCFLPNKATVLETLHRLLYQSTSWQWTDKHEKAYAVAKQLLQACYYPLLLLVMPRRMGWERFSAILSQMDERPLSALHPERCLQQREIMRKLIKRHWPSFLQLRNFTSTLLVVILWSLLTTSPF